MTKHILFVASGLNLAMPASRVKAVHEQLPVQQIAGTHNWFLGLGVAKGRLLPVTDLGAFAGRQPCSGRVLELEPDTAVAAFRIDEVSGFTEIEPVSSDNTATRKKGVDQQLCLSGLSVKNNDCDHYLIDTDALVSSEAFINIRETTA